VHLLVIAERGPHDTMNGTGAGGSRRSSRSGRGRPVVGWCGGVGFGGGALNLGGEEEGREGKGKRAEGVKWAGGVWGMTAKARRGEATATFVSADTKQRFC
jgi:hypothetical protein